MVIKSKKDFIKFLEKYSEKEKECFLVLKRGKPKDDNFFYYIDAVEIALCYGWIDSTLTKINGVQVQRFTPRNKKSNWSELNKERCRRLIKLGLMKKSGYNSLPDLELKEIEIPTDIKNILIKEKLLNNFNSFPDLYKRIRLYNLQFTKKVSPEKYNSAIENFIKNTKQNKMYGEWNDYGRLINY